MYGLKKRKKIKLFNFLVPILVLVLITTYFIVAYGRSFDETIFSVDNIHDHIRELSSSKYNGRLVGSRGNELTLQYVENHFKNLGIEPGGQNGTYYQDFDTMITQIDSNPHFTIENVDGEILEEFKLFKDYKFFTYWYGGGGRFKGDILFVDKHLYDVPKQLLKDKIVVMGTFDIRIKDVEYVLENGSRGILFRRTSPYDKLDRELQLQKKVENTIKTGKSIFFGYLGGDAYYKIKHHSSHEAIDKQVLKDIEIKRKIPRSVGLLKGVDLKCDIDYPVVKSVNIFGKIEGKRRDEYLIIGANIDHVGSGIDGQYFPGALNNASGTGMMLELARIIKSQRNLPEKTIIFAGWNARENVAAGSQYYVENPLYSLGKTQVINLGCIGNKNEEKIIFESEEKVGKILRNKFFQYSEDLKDTEKLEIQGIEAKVGSWSDHMPFIEAKVPAINVTDGYSNMNTYKDTIDNVSKEKLEKIGIVLTSYIKREVFKDTLPDFFNGIELALIIVFLLGAVLIYIILSFNKGNLGISIFSATIEDIYYSSGFNALLKFYYFVTPAFIILFSLIFIANLPPSFNLEFHNGQVYTNLSMYLSLKKSVLYIRNLIFNGLGTTENHVEIIKIMYASVGRSMKLILTTIAISLVLGVLKGMFDSYRGGRKGALRTLGTLITFSLPDVLIVLCGMLLITFISKSDTMRQLFDLKVLRGFIIPLLTLSIIPMVYISRITFIVVQEEVQKGYVVAARSKGLTKFQVFTKHILISVILKVIDSIPTLITIIISNLIVVEYLLNYKGILFNLYRFYEGHDVTSFIGFSLALGLIYILFITVSKAVSKLINPMKREGAQ
ncbi:MAG: M28 family peptidase [Maledivibacter sp.]|jgi:ABC-type dipeptide/oligopeptide/nickel transport system permease component|nr:M28 family peptidase [Maledivibacter sp.]